MTEIAHVFAAPNLAGRQEAKGGVVLSRLEAVAQRVTKLRDEPLKERVAVPNPKGGFYMEVRVIAPR